MTIYHGDCLDVLPEMPTVDAFITDPPFEAEAHSLQRRINRSPTRGSAEDIVTSEPLDFSPIDERTRDAVCLHAGRICRGWFLAFCQVEAVSLWRGSVVAGGGYV